MIDGRGVVYASETPDRKKQAVATSEIEQQQLVDDTLLFLALLLLLDFLLARSPLCVLAASKWRIRSCSTSKQALHTAALGRTS